MNKKKIRFEYRSGFYGVINYTIEYPDQRNDLYIKGGCSQLNIIFDSLGQKFFNDYAQGITIYSLTENQIKKILKIINPRKDN